MTMWEPGQRSHQATDSTVRGFESRQVQNSFFNPKRPQRLWAPGSIRRPEREVDHTPPPGFEITNAWNCDSPYMLSWRGDGQFFVTFLIQGVGPKYRLNNGSGRICLLRSDIINARKKNITRRRNTACEETRPGSES